MLAEVPVATLGEQCIHCSVRSLCDAYWDEAASDPADLATERGSTTKASSERRTA